MPTLQAQVEFSEQEREQQQINEIKPLVDKAAEAIGTTPAEIEADIRKNVGDFKVFGQDWGDVDLDPDEAKLFIKGKIAKQVVDDYSKYLEDGGEEDDETTQFMQALKDKYDLDKDVFDVINETAGDTIEGIKEFVGTAGETLTNTEKRTSFLDSLGGAMENAADHPLEFLDALATLGMDSVLDKVPTGFFQAGKDIRSALSGGRPTNVYDIKFDEIKSSPFTGKSVEQLEKGQPVASFIATIVPFLLNRGRTITGTLGKELALDVGTSTAGTNVGGTFDERQKQRGVNAVVTLLATLGVEGGIRGVKNAYNGLLKKGVAPNEATVQVVQELQQQAQKVATGELPVDLDKVAEVVEKQMAPLQKPQPKKYFQVPGEKFRFIDDMNNAQLNEYLKKPAEAAKNLAANTGITPEQAMQRITDARKVFKAKGTKILTKKDRAKMLEKVRGILTKEEAPKPSKSVTQAEPKPVKKGVKKQEKIAKQVAQQKFKVSKKEVQAANKESAKATEKALNQLDIDKAAAKGATAPVTSAELPFSGDFMDTLHSIGGASGLAGLSTLRLNTTPGMKLALDKYLDMYGFNKKINNIAKGRSREIYAKLVKDTGLTWKQAEEKYLSSGMYRQWAEGRLQDADLTPKELEAFKNLKKGEVSYNKINLALAKKLGADTKRWDPEAFTDSTRGNTVLKIDLGDNPKLRAEVEKAGFKVTELDLNGRKQDFVVLDYGSSPKDILNRISTGAEYYKKTAPFLFDESGQLNTKLFREEENVQLQLYQMAKEETITAAQFRAIADDLKRAGYEDKAIQEVMDAINDGKTPSDVIREKIEKLQLGSLAHKKGAKIGVNLDVVAARSYQNIQLSKQIYRRETTKVINNVKLNVAKFITDNTDRLTKDQVQKLKREVWTYDRLSDMVNGRPDPLEKLIISGVDTLGGNYYAFRDFMDQNLMVQSALKLGFNLSGSAANIMEVIKTTGDAAIQIPDKTWGQMLKGISNPVKYVADIEKKMSKSKRSVYYLEHDFDTSLDSRFKGKKGWASNVTENAVIKVGMSPFTGSIRFAKAYTYAIGEALGQTKGLKGQKLDDFIFDFMSERAQIQDLNVSALSRNNTAVKAALFLKNFQHRMFEFEAKAVSRLAGSVMKKSIDMDAARRVMAFTMVPTALFGVGASPTFMVANAVLSGGSNLVNKLWERMGGQDDIQVDPYTWLRAQAPGSVWHTLGHGAVAEATGISPKQLVVDPIAGLLSKPIIAQEAEDVVNFMGDIGHSIYTAAASGEKTSPAKFLRESVSAVERLLAKEVTGAGRAKKAMDIYKTGVVTNADDTPLEIGIDPKDRPVRAAVAAAGATLEKTDRLYAQSKLAHRAEASYDARRKVALGKIAKSILAGDEQGAKAEINLAVKGGIELSGEAIDGAIAKMQRPGVDRYREELRGARRQAVYDEIPEFFDQPEDDEEEDTPPPPEETDEYEEE